MALRVGDEVAAGMGDAVDLVIGVGEIGNPRRAHGTTVLEEMRGDRKAR